MKLRDIPLQSGLKVRGNVLSLASGRGGWEKELSKLGVGGISITLGPQQATLGHESISDRYWEGKELWMQCYGDITKVWEPGYVVKYKDQDFPLSGSFDIDWLLFDGGESKSKANEEI